VLDFDVTGALSRDANIDHIDSRLVVTEHDGGPCRRKVQVGHDSSHIASVLCSGDSGKELSFSGAGGSNGLRFAWAGDGATTEKESIACSRATIAQVVDVHNIEECDCFPRIHSGKFRKFNVHGRADEVGRWKRGVGLQPTVHDAPILGSTKIFCYLLQHGKMMIMRACGELR